ncbi:uncharacterized protein LOC144655983 isoform X2 [Oculina patagonica]
MTTCINRRPMIAITTLFLFFLRLSSARSNSSHLLPDCDFENSTFCGWENDKSGRAKFNWIIWSGSTSSPTTGPHSDESGNGRGKYAYMKATGRQHGDNVRIISPTMQGPKCMSMMYHMYGSTMGSLIIYMRTNSNETVQWIKSGNHPDRWFKAAIFIDSSVDYQIVLEGVRGTEYSSDIAIDSITFTNGICQTPVFQTLHAFMKTNGVDFKLDRIPAHTGWIYQFTMQATQTRNSSDDMMYFVYPADSVLCPKSLTRQLSLDKLHCLPVDFLYSSTNYQEGYRKVLLMNRGAKLSSGIALEDYNACCDQQTKEYFFANVTMQRAPDYCPPGWRRFEETCFQVHLIRKKPWDDARFDCRNRGGQLAVFENGFQPHKITKFMDDYFDELAYISVGAKASSDGRWQWLGGRDVTLGNIWHSGYPSVRKKGECGVLAEGSSEWRLFQAGCHYEMGFLCETYERNYVSGRPTSNLSQAVTIGSSFHVVDGNIATCFTIKGQTGKQNWWSVTLEGTAFVYKIWIINRPDCCLEPLPNVQVILSNNETSAIAADCEVYDWIAEKRRLLVCKPSIMATNVTILADEANSLSLCEVLITATDREITAHGVRQELWYKMAPTGSIDSLWADRRFPSNPDVVNILQNFDAPYNFHTNYGQRLIAYLRVPESGNYTFYVACNDACELWLDTQQGSTLASGNDDEESGRILLVDIKQGYWTDHNQWNKHPSFQTSSKIWLSKCQFYLIETLMKQSGSQDCASVGMKFPNGTYERPIERAHLFWVRPGVDYVDFQIVRIPKVVKAGQKLAIRATYKYCCRGSYCPGCPVMLYFMFAEQKSLVHTGLRMDCQEHSFNTTLETVLQEGTYAINVSSEMDELLSYTPRMNRQIGEVNVKAMEIERCNFTSDLCSWSNMDGGWKLLVDSALGKGILTHVGDKPALLKSPWIAANAIYQKLGLCLTFTYLLPNYYGSSLSVFLVTKSNLSIWSLSGHQGDKWLNGQVSITTNDNFKVMFVAKGKSPSNVTVNDIRISTKSCEQFPHHSVPGYTCEGKNSFQCDNGQCVSKEHVCDGDKACDDNSDEKDCKCITTKFLCPTGECLDVEDLCDEANDCDDKTDESRCERSCSEDSFPCAGGGCTAWSLTCDGKRNCEDGTDEPSICGSSNCSLLNLSCARPNHTDIMKLHQCAGNRVKCDFQYGLCGLKHESKFRWSIGSGSTPTRNTGPDYDHSTFLPEGNYIFLEASDKQAGEAAVLTSSTIPANKATCVQFWYHMKGQEIGSLNIFIQTNESRSLVWSQAGDKGANWLFGQVGHKGASKSYKVVLEGVVGNGVHGDIAVDDFSLLDGEECQTIFGNEHSGCLFELDHCTWESSGTWRMSKIFPLRFLRKDWQNSLGGFTYFKGCSTRAKSGQNNLVACYGNLKSHHISAGAGWKCLQFWYYLGSIGFTSLEVILISNETKWTVWTSTSHENNVGVWSYALLPINSMSNSYQVLFEVWKSSWRAIIALDDIVFLTDSCQTIPWQDKSEDYGKNPLDADYFWKLDGTDKGVRLQGSAVYKTEDGLTSLYLDGKAAYAEIPAINIRKRSFSISIRLKIHDVNALGHILSDWSWPFQFRLYIYRRKVQAVLRRSGLPPNVQFLLQMYSDQNIKANVWTHVVFTWNRKTLKGKLYFNGIKVGDTPSSYTGQDIDLNLTNHTVYEIGFKKDTGEVLQGSLRDLVVVLRTLSPGDVSKLYRPTRALCPMRRTTNGNCCAFPFVYQKKERNACTSADREDLWCQTSSINEQGQMSGFCDLNYGCFEFREGVCGWVNSKRGSRQWKPTTKQEMESLSYLKPGFTKESNYQLNFPGNHRGYVNITDMPDLSAFTLCFWMKSSDRTSAGTPIWYRVRYENPGRYVTAIALLDYRGFYVYIGETTSSKTSVVANDGKWHHICLVWTSRGGKVNFYYDKTKLSGSRFSDGEKIPGKGEFIVGLTKDQARLDNKAGEFIGSISAVNMFNMALDSSVITWMSHGCGENLANAILPWSQFVSSFVGDVNIQRPALCTDSAGSRFIVSANKSSQSFQPSVFESPLYERYYEGHSVCVRFRYIMYGYGRRALRLYQQLDLMNRTRRLMWAANESNNTEGTWKYGRVSLPSVTKHRVSFEADLGNNPGYVGFRGLHVIPGYCHPVPLRATEACDRNFTDPSGLIFSPRHPGYYPPLTRCLWMIKVPPENTVKLRFLEFQLEDHPSCFNDYIEVYNSGKTKTFVGRYCGERFPEFIQSSSNVMEINFVSNEKVSRAGLKLHYTAEKATNGKINCVQSEGCPSSCECNFISPKHREMVITVKTGRELTAIPGNIPSNAAVILFQRNKISYLPKKVLPDLSMLKYLDLSGNRLFRIERGAFANVSSLQTLKLEWNFMRTLSDGIFHKMVNLQTLDCSFNLIEDISSSALASLMSLTTLSLRQNRIKVIDKDAFNNTTNLLHLYLQHNLLEELPDNTFFGLSKLRILSLEDNKIRRLTSKTFAGLSSLEKLNLELNSISLKDFSPDAFNGLTSLKEIRLDEFILCCYAEKATPGVHCVSPKDEFSSCSDLMKNKAVQVCVWILGLSALLGNLFVILMRVIVKEKNKVHSFLLTNLAMSDLLMGVYLLIVAVKDVQWQGEYFKHDINWRSGSMCALTGVLSMVSSEVSVLMLTLITTDRLVCIVFPFKVKRMNRALAYIIVVGIWIFGILISTIPTFGLNYFYDSERNVGFYGKSAVCLPLHLSSERQAGWEYAVGFFIGLNSASFVYILVAYIVMFFTVKGVSKQVRSTNMNRESQMAKRMVFIILTDFLCWMPVIIIGIFSLFGQFHDPEKQAYVWIAVFVLPLNSSINPILYTFSTPLVKKKITEKTEALSNFFERTIQWRNTSSSVQQGILLNSLPHRNNTFLSDSQTTLRSSLSPSPIPSTSARPLDEISEHEAPETDLKLIETPNVFPDETSYSVGFVAACSGNEKDMSVRLIKHFSKVKEDAWRKEAELAKELSDGDGHPNVLKYCWHARNESVLNYKWRRYPRLKKSSFLLCYDFESSTPLDEFLRNSTLNLDAVLVVAIDLTYAIQHLEQNGVVHNNITASNVLIGRGLRIPPITAVLGGFGSAQWIYHDFPESVKNGHMVKDILGKNVLQFGFVLAELIKACLGTEEFGELQEVVHLCFEQDPDVRPNASQVRDLLEELWYRNDIWDTTL